MKLIGYYSIISSLILSDIQNFQSEFTGYNFGINKDKFYYADLDVDKDKVYILDDTDNIMTQSKKTGKYKNVDNFNREARDAFTDMIKFMRSKYYNKKYDIR